MSYTRFVVTSGNTQTLTTGGTYTAGAYAGNGAAGEVKTGGTLIGGSVTFSGNTATNGGAIYVQGTATFEDSTFSGNTATNVGGVINNNGGTISFTGETTTFSDNAANTEGGAIRNYSGTVIFSAKHTTFSSNTSTSGGAIINRTTMIVAGIVDLETANDTIVNNGTLKWNLTAAQAGDSVCINNFQYCSGSGVKYLMVDAKQGSGTYTIATGVGSAVTTGSAFSLVGAETSGKTITVNGSVVSYGSRQYTLTQSGTDLLLNVYYPKITVTSGQVETLDTGATYTNPNTNESQGGEIKIETGGTLTGTTVTLAGNTANEGGAIYNQGTATFEGSTFSGNAATNGTVIYNLGTATFEDSTFSGNTATNVGGVINNNGGTVNFTGATTVFSGNTAKNQGGAIRNNSGSVYLSAKRTIFNNNTAPSGGAIINQTYGTLTVAGVVDLETANDTIVNNGTLKWDLTAANPGNSVCINNFQYCSGSGAKFITVNSEQVAGSYTIATDVGSAVSIGSAFSLVGAETSGKTITVNGSMVSYGSRKYTLTKTDTDLLLNVYCPKITVTSGSTVTLDTGATYTNPNYDGSEVTVNSGGTLNGINVTFAANTATNGGAIYNQGTVTLQDSTFSGNTATNVGGVINNNGGTISFTGDTTTFSNNTAITEGGAIRNNSGSVYLSAKRTTFNNNTSPSGGAIINKGTLTVAGVVDLETANDTIVNNGTLRWNLTAANPGDSVCINNFQYYSGSGAKFITVNSEQVAGTYTIATDVGSAVSTGSAFSLVGLEGGITVTVNGSVVTYGSRKYTLTKTDTDLLLNVYYPRITVTSGQEVTLDTGATYTNPNHDGSEIEVKAGGTLNGINVTFAANTATNGGAIYNQGTVTLQDSSFSDNTATNVGGVINNNGGTVNFTGATAHFSGNTAATQGGAIRNNSGTVNINASHTVFNGNSSSVGGAIFNQNTATLNIAGEIELCTTSDTIVTYSNITIDVDKFGSGDCYKVIDDTVAEEHSDLYTMNSGSKFVTDDETYSATIYDHDVYVYKNNGPFASAIITDGGTATSVTINGVEYTGVAYDFEHADKSKAFGASSVFYSGLTQTGNLNLACSTTGNATVGLKDSHVTGYVYGTQDAKTVIGGDFTFQMEDTTIDSTSEKGRLYVGGVGTISGTLTANVVNSTLDVICATAADSGTVTAMVTNLTNSTVTTEVRGTGSAEAVSVGDVIINLTGSTVGAITGNYGNTVTGTVALNVTGATASTVNGAISEVDTITIASGAELIVGNTVTMTTSLVNSGTLNWDLTKGSATNLDFSISDWAKYDKDSTGTLTVTVSATSQYGGNYALADNVADDDNFAVTLKGLTDEHTLSLNGTSSVTVGTTYYGLSKTLGTVSLTIAEVKACGSTTHCDGAATRITGGTNTKMFFGGTVCKSTAAVESNSSVSIEDGTFAKSIAAGSVASGCTVQQTGNLDLTIEGGTFAQRVAGGMYAADENAATVAELTGDVKLTIKGGTFTGRIYGGSNAKDDDSGVKTTITGDVNVTVDSSKNSIYVGNYLVGGSRGKGAINGNVTVTFTGFGSDHAVAGEGKLTFNGGTSVVAGGCNGDVIKISGGTRTTSSTVTGSRNLVFDNFDGDFDADLRLFSTATFKNDSDVTLTDTRVNLWTVETWNFEAGSSLAGLQANDFEGDTIKFDLTNWDENDWQVASGGVKAFDDLDKATAVWFGMSEVTEYDTEHACWTDGTYKLALSSDKTAMIVSKIA